MNRGKGGPTPLGIVVFVVLIIILVIGAFFVVTGGGDRTPSVLDEPEVSVIDTSSDRSVRLTVYGNIVANEERNSYQVTISPDTRLAEARKGYAGRAIETRQFNNSAGAYEEFVYALEKLDYQERRELPDEKIDPRGTCATGNRYVFEILEFGEVIDTAWTTTCGGSKGNFAGEYERAEDLFRAQIPEDDMDDVIDSLDD